MTFDEWWETLTIREQHNTGFRLTETAWQVSAKIMQERCAREAEKEVTMEGYEKRLLALFAH